MSEEIKKLIEESEKFPIELSKETLKKIPFVKKVVAKLIGYVKLGRFKPKKFKDFEYFYLVYCRRHKIYFIDYPHGFEGYFNCPKCTSFTTFQP